MDFFGEHHLFGKNDQKHRSGSKDGLAKKTARGNMDEYEALRTIVNDNPGLLARVLDKIRQIRTMKEHQKKISGSPPPSQQDDQKK